MNIFMEKVDLMFKLLFVNIPQYQWPLCFDLKHDPNILFKNVTKRINSCNEKTTKIY